MEENEKYGLDQLKDEVMEGVSLDKISKKDIKWCARQWHLMMALTYAGMLANEVLKDRECYYGNLMIKLEERIESLGGKVRPMQSIEIPERKVRFLNRIRYAFKRIHHALA